MPLQLNWVGSDGSSLSHRPFNLGAAHSESSRPFALEGPPASSFSRRPFALLGGAFSTSIRPFALVGPATSVSVRPFRLDGPPPSSWGTYGPSTPVWGYTSLIQTAYAGDSVIYPSNTTGFRPGQHIILGSASEDATVSSVGIGVVDLTAPLAQQWVGGTPVRYALPAAPPAPPAVLASGSSAGATTVTVVTAYPYTAGTPLLIGSETVVVESVAGAVVTLASPLLFAHLTGEGVASAWGHEQAIGIYTKAGTLIGSIGQATVTSAPSREISNAGSCSFYVHGWAADASLIYDDRIAVLQTADGEAPWAGPITPQVYESGGLLTVYCDDIFALLAGGPSIDLKEELPDGTEARLLFERAIALHNTNAATNGEVQWEVDAQGSAIYYGDLAYTGDIMGFIRQIASTSNSEFIWDVRTEGDAIIPTLRTRDHFDAGAGPTLKDGPDDDANIVDGSISALRDPRPLAFKVKLTGQPFDLSECLPDWASWAGRVITPEVTVEVPAGDHRMREAAEITVPWGLSHAEKARLCAAVEDSLYAMYFDFLKAIHDIEGRPYHEGYLFAGPTDYFESDESGADGLSRRTWRTRLQLVETYENTPASAVMLSDSTSQIDRNSWLIVTYNRVTGEQNVIYWTVSESGGASLSRFHLPDGTNTIIYFASGGRIYDRQTLAPVDGYTPGTGAFIESYNTRLYDPVYKRYRNLRRILNGAYAHVGFVDPADPDVTITALSAGAAIDFDTLSELIGKVYDFEMFNIENWDPRRDGVGVNEAFPTVFNGSPTGRPRWHLQSYGGVDGATTTMLSGISASDTLIEVASAFGFPVDEDLPFYVGIDHGLDREVVKVTAMAGSLWTIERGAMGTDSFIHEAGAPVDLIDGAKFDGLLTGDYQWPEGEAVANALLARLSVPERLLRVQVAMARTPPHLLPLGAICPTDIITEGPTEGISDTVRIVGVSPDPLSGVCEVVIENWTV